LVSLLATLATHTQECARCLGGRHASVHAACVSVASEASLSAGSSRLAASEPALGRCGQRGPVCRYAHFVLGDVVHNGLGKRLGDSVPLRSRTVRDVVQDGTHVAGGDRILPSQAAKRRASAVDCIALLMAVAPLVPAVRRPPARRASARRGRRAAGSGMAGGARSAPLEEVEKVSTR
jgi:hypothetical protein